ncbi:BrxA/BrxB family bacilliredoxin [Exiguobacterium aestuarii]|uniref:BrxA/BrxB family bacilliredoxin n=1 Tax=Exiguobacterium aestuarii TaxID=273527 RepID=A0ABW2PJB1_9BACL|nr:MULTISPECIES: BrxA/BrxB family bacilliredoxin [Exiguobacterium]MCT4785692.1 BrxA/BrxB family bacilliredoxin [Exiguobacterium aestuarii]
MDFQLYFQDVVEQARNEVRAAGYTELTTPEEVDGALKKEGKTLVLVNSVCGCAGGIARPAAAYVNKMEGTKPDHFVTVFAGQDREATDRAREYFEGYAPSSPSIALLEDGNIVTMVERSEIESSTAEELVDQLQTLFDIYFA